MLTLGLCYINSKYKTGYELMFIVTFILDGKMIDVAKELLLCICSVGIRGLCVFVYRLVITRMNRVY